VKEKASACSVRNDGVDLRAARKREELTLDSDDLARLNRFDVREARGHERQQVFQAVRLRMENDNCDLADVRFCSYSIP